MRPSGHAPIKPRDTVMRQQNTMPLTQRLQHACALVLVVCACAFAAHAQQNDNPAPGTKAPAKNIAGMSSSDGPNGAKVTITSDGALNDYSAYRSGDRFYVVIPQANAKGVGNVRGRGFEGAQVSRRGQDVIMSFKLQPGATARVDQRFNKLVVQFNAADVGAQTATQNTNRPPAQPTPEPRAQPTRTPVELAGTPTATPAARPTPDTNKPTPTVGNLPPGVIPTPLSTPPTIAQASPTVVAVPSPSVTSLSTPAATPQQIAQLQPPPAGPITTTNAPAPATSVALGTTVLRNWPLLLIALILLAGLGLFVFTRGTEQREALAAVGEPAWQQETPKRALTAKETVPVATTAAASTPPVVVPPPVIVTPPVSVTPPVAPAPTKAAAPPVVAAPVTKSVTPPKSKKAKRAAQKREAAAAAKAAELVAAKTAAVETEASSAPATVEPDMTAATIATGALVAVGAGALTAESAPVVANAEPATEEMRKLLAGEVYDEAVIGTQDAGLRRVVASELMTALATESESDRIERARAGFVKHGYFADVARDLRTAEAPEQRASAARTLGLVGDRAATAHLFAALEDPAAEVRRASVEALTELQDPAAVSPLEALRWRETARTIPRSLIQTAIEACAVAAPLETPTMPAAESQAIESAAVELAADEPPAVEPIAFAPVIEAAPEPAVELAEPAAEAMPDETALAFDETTQERVPVTAEAEPVTAAYESAHIAAPGESVEVELPAVVSTSEERAPAPVIVSDETAEIVQPPPELESAPAVSAMLAESSALAATLAVEAPEIEPESALAETTIEETVNTAPPVALDAFAPAQVTPEVVKFDDIAWPTTEPAAPEIAPGADTTDAADEPATPFGIESATSVVAPVVGAVPVESVETAPALMLDEVAPAPVELDAPPAPHEGAFTLTAPTLTEQLAAQEMAATEETKDITEFVMTPSAPAADDWFDIEVDEHKSAAGPATANAPTSTARGAFDTEVEEHTPAAWSMPTEVGATTTGDETTRELERLTAEPIAAAVAAAPAVGAGKELDLAGAEEERLSIIPKAIQLRLESDDAGERAASVLALAQLNTDEAFQQICTAFDDHAPEVREAAARALYSLADDRADSFTRALREADPERRRHIGAAISSSGLADEAVSNLTGESRDKTYDAFSLLFLMAKAGETAPLIHSIETHPDSEVRLAVVKLLALSGQHEILPSFRRLAVRGSLPTEVRSAVMEAIYQISSQPQQTT